VNTNERPNMKTRKMIFRPAKNQIRSIMVNGVEGQNSTIGFGKNY
jgi:hypothetical protein